MLEIYNKIVKGDKNTINPAEVECDKMKEKENENEN